MTDEVKPVEQEAAQPETPVVEKPPVEVKQPEAEQEKPITREELALLKDEIIRDVNMRSRQRAQQIKQEVDRIKSILAASGQTVTPEQEEKIQTQVAVSYEEKEEQPTGAPQSDDIPPELLPAFTWMANQGDYKVLDTDPEYKEYLEAYLNKDNVDPAELTILFSRAVEAKKARTLQLKDKAPLRAPVGGGEGLGEFVANKASDYWSKAYQK